MLETICEIFNQAYQRGFIAARDGNASVHYRDQNYFLITPSGVRKPDLHPEMFVTVRPITSNGYEVVEHDLQMQASGELPLHFGLQRKCDTDTRVVLHMHPTYTVAAMYYGVNLSSLVSEFSELGYYTRVGETVPIIPPISQELADACVTNLGYDAETGHVANNIIGIDRHGVIAVDSDPWRAFEHIERLEHICKIVMAAG